MSKENFLSYKLLPCRKEFWENISSGTETEGKRYWQNSQNSWSTHQVQDDDYEEEDDKGY